MPLTRLFLGNIGPFADIQFEFDESVNVFVGPNNSGKSTALLALAHLATYPVRFPDKLLHNGGSSFRLEFTSRFEARQGSIEGKLPWGDSRVAPGYRERFELLNSLGFSIFVPDIRFGKGFRSTGPKRLASPPEEAREAASKGEEKKRELQFSDLVWEGDRTLVQRMIDLDYKALREKKPSIRRLISEVAALASEVTEGFPIEFVQVGEDQSGLFPLYRTPDGEIPLEALSQGTQSLLHWLALLLFEYARYYDYPNRLDDKPGVLIIDEIDAHLHPSWQRRIIPSLRRRFPGLQIFCSTHSPLMLAGLKQGQVQLLQRQEGKRVSATRNETDIIGWSAEEILRCFLEIPNPTDLETAQQIRRLQELRSKDKLTKQESRELEKLRRAVHKTLLGGPLSSQLEHLEDYLDSHSIQKA